MLKIKKQGLVSILFLEQPIHHQLDYIPNVFQKLVFSCAGIPNFEPICIDPVYLLVAKPGDHQALFAALETSEETQYYEVSDEKGFFHQFRFLNEVALNQSNPDVCVNVLEYMQRDPKGKEIVFSGVTNIHVTRTNLFALMKGGRARWKIENETFNTLKNLGYNLEHNYGHGKKFLSTILCLLIMRVLFKYMEWLSWEQLYQFMISRKGANTS